MASIPPDRPHPGDGNEDAEAREFDAFAAGQDAVDIAAVTWLLREQAGMDAAQRARFQAWLDEDPRHGAVHAEMAGTMRQVDALRRVRAPGRGKGALADKARLAVLATTVAAGAWLGWDHWRQLPTFERTYATGTGQQRSLVLPDAPDGSGAPASRLVLDSGSRLKVRLYRDRREVELAEGQALFEVGRDPARPFRVRAGDVRITVVGTQFSVRRTGSGLDAGRTVVAVREGRVSVARLQADAVELAAGQMVTADASGALGPVAKVATSAVAGWQAGRISFDQTRLADALAEFERYGRTGLVIRDPAVAAMPVGGSYDVRQVQRFADALPQLLPVRLVQRGKQVEIVASAQEK